MGTGLSALQPGGGAFDAVLVLHVASAIVGIGAVVVTGGYAASAVRGPEPSEAVLRYFRPGINWPGRSLYLVPVLGLALVGMSRGAYGLGQTWLWSSLVIWTVSIVAAEVLLWPGEARIQRELSRPHHAPAPEGLSEHDRGAGSAGGQDKDVTGGTALSASRSRELHRAALRVVWSAAAVTLLLVVAFGFMLARPGGPA